MEVGSSLENGTLRTPRGPNQSRDGSESELSTWQGRPGTTTRLDAGTVLKAGDIAAIEVRALDGDLVLLRGSPAP